MQSPLKGSPAITQKFGANAVDYSQFGLKGHHGIDYGVGTGTPVYATENGKVELSANGVTDKYTGRFASGETITINGTHEVWYMHLSKRLVQAGAKVSAGQLIGYSGATGFVTGPHLHLGVRPFNPNLNNGYRGFIDPLKVIQTATKPSAPAQGGSKVTKSEATSMLTAVADKLFGQPFDSKGLAHYVGLVTGGTYTPGKAISEIFDGTQAQNHLKDKYGKTVTKTMEKVVRDPKDIERIKELEADLAEAKTQNTPPNADISHIRAQVDKLVNFFKNFGK